MKNKWLLIGLIFLVFLIPVVLHYAQYLKHLKVIREEFEIASEKEVNLEQHLNI